MNSNPNPPNDRAGAVGAALYYGITAIVVVGIAVAVIAGKFFYRRKARKEIKRRNDLERQEQARRGEAGGLPTYFEHPNTVALSIPTLAYPDAARRADGTINPAALQDPSLPSYDAAAPPKYEYATGQAGTTMANTAVTGVTNAATAAGGAISRAASTLRQALYSSSSRPASLRRNDSAQSTIQMQEQSRQQSQDLESSPNMQETTSSAANTPRIMTSAPVMHVLSSQSRNQSRVSLSRASSMRTARSSAAQPEEEQGLESVPLDEIERSRQ